MVTRLNRKVKKTCKTVQNFVQLRIVFFNQRVIMKPQNKSVEAAYEY